MKAGINVVTAAVGAGVLLGLLLTHDGRAWLRHPTLMLGGQANASAVAPAEPAFAPSADPVALVATAPKPVPVTPISQRFAAGRLRVGVFGDSMGDGLYTALYRDLRDAPGVTVTKFSEVSTGLSRYDYVDIQAKTERQLRADPVDVAVVLFGTNDAQGISLDGAVHDFGTPGWRVAYAKRVTDLITLLRANDVAVYWVGLPRMKRASFDEKMTLINSVVEERMKALNVPYLPTVAVTSNSQGDYEAYLPAGDSNRPTLMRANDGIHMSMAGYLRIAAPVAERLKRDAGIGAATATPAPAA